MAIVAAGSVVMLVMEVKREWGWLIAALAIVLASTFALIASTNARREMRF
jgi:hypothetical protein